MRRPTFVLPLALAAHAAAQGVLLPIEPGPVVALAAGDVNGDGRMDILVGAEERPLQLLTGRADGQFAGPTLLPGEPWKVRAIAFGDLDGDGDLDVLAGGVDCLTRCWLNDGDGQFVEASGLLPETKLWVTGIALGDVDGDGDLDCVLSNFAGRDALYRNTGGGRFEDDSGALPRTLQASSAVLLADLDGDKDLDIVVGQRPDASGKGGQNRAARNDGARFTDATDAWMPSATGNTTALALADVDGDQHLDLVTAVRGIKPREPARSGVHRRGPDGRFLGSSSKRFPGAMAIAQALAAGDVDGDGDVDLVYGNDGTDDLYLNDGTGVFALSTRLPRVVEDTRALLLVDVDGDGDLDVVTGNGTGTVRWFVNGGGGDFGGGGGGGGDAVAPEAGTDRAAPAISAVAAGKYARRAQAKTTVAEKTARATIDTALIFLADHQADDGRWDTDMFVAGDFGDPACDGAHDVGVTGLALLCFLAEGSHQGGGFHADLCARALRFLLAQQDASGLFGTAATNHGIYDHAIATLAVAECCALAGDDALRLPLQRALAEIERRRLTDGGFRYAANEPAGDTSVTAWCAYAMAAGADVGLAPPPGAVARTLAFVRSMTDPATGRCGYNGRGGLSARETGGAERFPSDGTDAMTGAGVFARILLGDRPDGHADLALGMKLMAARPPQPAGTAYFDPYGWFQVAHALSALGGEEWATWRKALHAALASRQRKGGELSGSFDPDEPWGAHGGRFAATALATLALQAEYRFSALVDPRWRTRAGR